MIDLDAIEQRLTAAKDWKLTFKHQGYDRATKTWVERDPWDAVLHLYIVEADLDPDNYDVKGAIEDGQAVIQMRDDCAALLARVRELEEKEADLIDRLTKLRVLN